MTTFGPGSTFEIEVIERVTWWRLSSCLSVPPTP